MFKIYTRNGDFGQSTLPKINKNISKSDLVFDVVGTFDELNTTLGFLHTARLADVAKTAQEVQKDLLNLGSLVISPEKIPDAKVQFWETRVKELEEVIDYFSSKVDPLDKFLLVGGCRESSFSHLARVVCRRLERLVVKFVGKRKDRLFVVKYLNRLSDLLFVMARYSNKKLGFKDILWENK